MWRGSHVPAALVLFEVEDFKDAVKDVQRITTVHLVDGAHTSQPLAMQSINA